MLTRAKVENLKNLLKETKLPWNIWAQSNPYNVSIGNNEDFSVAYDLCLGDATLIAEAINLLPSLLEVYDRYTEIVGG